MAGRIYAIVKRAVANRTNYNAVVRNIDSELDKVKPGGGVLKEELEKAKAEAAGFASELKQAQDLIKEQTAENDKLKAELEETLKENTGQADLVGELEEKVKTLEEAAAETPDADPTTETTETPAETPAETPGEG